MSSTRRSLLSAGALAGSALSFLACSTPDDVSSLGVYYERSEDSDATHGEGLAEASAPTDAADASAPVDASFDGGQSDADADLDPFPPGAPPCARTGCVGSEASAQVDPAVHCQTVNLSTISPPPMPPGSLKFRVFGFNFAPRIQGVEYLRSISPSIDDPQALLYLKMTESMPQSGDPTQTQLPPRLIYQWSPGVAGLFLDPSVGIAVAPDTNYVLELGYGSEADTEYDRSGLQICFTPNAPEYLVSLSSLRAKGPPVGPATGTCAPQHTAPIVVLSAQPYAVGNGRNVKVVLDRPGSSALGILDAPYQREVNPSRPLSLLVLPGDTFSTRCEFEPPALADFDARCEVSMLHWPAHTLVTAPGIGPAKTLAGCGP